jgi:hypothetical protein
MDKDEALQMCLEYIETDAEKDAHERKYVRLAIKQALAAPVQPVAWFKHGPYEDGEPLSVVFENPHDDVCYSPLGFIEPPTIKPAPDLQAELEATNRQVEILSDALAESRKEVAALKAVQEPWGYGRMLWDDKLFLPTLPSVRDGGWMALYTTPPAQPAPTVQEPLGKLCVFDDADSEFGWSYDISGNAEQHRRLKELGGAMLYTTQPAAEFVCSTRLCHYKALPDPIHHTDLSEHPEYISGWNDYRAAMLEMMK